MNSLNSIILEGNLTRDPETQYTTKGTALCHFTVASNRQYKQENTDDYNDEVSYFDIESWGKQAEICEKYLEKGRGIRVVGRLKQNRWEQDGHSRSKIVIVAEHIEFRPKTKATPSNQEVPFHV